jgi:hypothetical protein
MTMPGTPATPDSGGSAQDAPRAALPPFESILPRRGIESPFLRTRPRGVFPFAGGALLPWALEVSSAVERDDAGHRFEGVLTFEREAPQRASVLLIGTPLSLKSLPQVFEAWDALAEPRTAIAIDDREAIVAGAALAPDPALYFPIAARLDAEEWRRFGLARIEELVYDIEVAVFGARAQRSGPGEPQPATDLRRRECPEDRA